MKVKFLFPFAISAALAFAFCGCSESDVNNDSVFKQSYYVRLGTVHPFYESRYYAADSLVNFITDNMGLEKDTVPTMWLVAGENAEACDKEILSRFEKACSLVDPDEYGGQYSVAVYREDSDDSMLTIAEKEFMSTAENSGFDWIIDWVRSWGGAVVPDDKLNRYEKDFYIYDLAISAGDCHDSAMYYLTKSGYTPIIQDLNQKAGGKYIYIGYKMGTAEDKTGIWGDVMNGFTGIPENRELTAKEAAISCIIALQEKHSPHPDTLQGPEKSEYKDYIFQSFKKLGLSNGDTNQGTGKNPDCYLYFSRNENDRRYLYYLNVFSWTGSDYDAFMDKVSQSYYLVKDTQYYKDNKDTGRCHKWEYPCDLNSGTGGGIWIYMNAFFAYPNNSND